jgi:uncharacterized phiE125 gp8 family phage protein
MRLTNASTIYTAHHETPAATPEDLRELLRLNESDETDAYLNGLLLAATMYAEKYLNRTFIYSDLTRQYEVKDDRSTLALERYRDTTIYLPYGPVIFVDRVYAVDMYGAETEIDVYRLDIVSSPAKLLISQSFCFDVDGLVKIDYTAGYGEYAANIPAPIVQGVLQHAAYMYEHRGDCEANEAAKMSGAHTIYGMYKVGMV